MGVISVYSLLSSSLPKPGWHSPGIGRHCQGCPLLTLGLKTRNKKGMERRSLLSAWLLHCCFLTNSNHLCSDKCYFGVCHFAAPSETRSYTHTHTQTQPTHLQKHPRNHSMLLVIAFTFKFVCGSGDANDSSHNLIARAEETEKRNLSSKCFYIPRSIYRDRLHR